MWGRLAACLMLAVSVLLAVTAAAEEKPSAIIAQAIDGFIHPGYRDFHRATTDLTTTTQALCTAPSQEALDNARKAFGDAVDAWSTVEIIRFGPVTEQNRLERILFWPDRKGTGLKQVQAALAAKDPSATDAVQLAGKSVAMQGLGALEFVLFGAGADALSGAGDAYRCAYGSAIAANLDGIAGELATAWAAPDGFAAVWARPGPGNALYRNDEEALTELLEVFINGAELVRDVRLGGFLGADPGKDRPKQALFWRSAKTVDTLGRNVAGMKSLLEASRLGNALAPDIRWIEQSALFEFGNAAKAAAAANGPIADVLADPERRGRLAYFGVVTSSLSEIFGVRMTEALGLTAGFSSLDGD